MLKASLYKPSLLASKLSCGVTCSTWNIRSRLGPMIFRKFIFCIAYLKASSMDSYSGSKSAAENNENIDILKVM